MITRTHIGEDRYYGGYNELTFPSAAKIVIRMGNIHYAYYAVLITLFHGNFPSDSERMMEAFRQVFRHDDYEVVYRLASTRTSSVVDDSLLSPQGPTGLLTDYWFVPVLRREAFA